MSTILPILPRDIVNQEIIQYLPLAQIYLPLEDRLLFREFTRRTSTYEPLNFLLSFGSLDEIPEEYLSVLPYDQKKHLFDLYLRNVDNNSANRIAAYLELGDIKQSGSNLRPRQIQKMVLDSPDLYALPLLELYAESLINYPLKSSRNLQFKLPMFTVFADYVPILLDTYHGNLVSQYLLELVIALAGRRANIDNYEALSDFESMAIEILEEDPENFWEEVQDLEVDNDESLSLLHRIIYDIVVRSLMNEVIRIYNVRKRVRDE